MDEKKEDTALSNTSEERLAASTNNATMDVNSIEQIVERMQGAMQVGKTPEKEDGDRLAAYIFSTDVSDDKSVAEVAEKDEKENKLSHYLAVLNQYKEARARQQEQIRQGLVQNTAAKEALLKRMEELLSSTESFDKIRQEFRAIRADWDGIGEVDPSLKNDYLTRYQKLMEDFYEKDSLTKEFRDLDFAKNKEIKDALIQKAENLAKADDVIAAFHALQSLHDQWRETGPVAPEFRADLWRQFKDASHIVNKRHAEHFVQIKEQEKENLDKKLRLCEEAEALLKPIPNTRETWNTGIERLNKLREEWKSIGAVPKKERSAVFTRFREAANAFYQERRASAKAFKEGLNEKLDRLEAIEQEAQSLKDSTEWNSTADRLIALQKEWKDVGALGVRVSKHNKLWQSFQEACNYFFNRRLEMFKEKDKLRADNMQEKLALIDEFEAAVKMHGEDKEQLRTVVNEMQERWANLGRVPQQYKDNVNDKYYGTLRAAEAKIRGGHRAVASAKSSNGATAHPAKSLQQELSSLNKEYQQMELSLSRFSSNGDPKKNPLIAPLIKKFERLKQRIDELEDQIKQTKNNN